jgi:hypothetical protein
MFSKIHPRHEGQIIGHVCNQTKELIKVDVISEGQKRQNLHR